ncbi:monovalent cation/H+ antiporter subunit D [Phenylobacterium sp.]|uniref:monovalent cation/H+ antiporter subunit D n=1 Tax=Phenylobacterium sp. TaxID=1871053 RepID=UPI00289B3CF8|nr:monovalent cation/H+ antiporter subunit D [Phenylobacterium sp.]
MTGWLIVPVALPAIVAALMVLFLRRRLMLSRIASLGATGTLAAVSVALLVHAGTGALDVYALGDWAAPFGIVLVLDRLSALMVALTSLLALPVLVYAIVTGFDRRGWHFHPLFQFQLLGLNGAFLTGDLFNLFVFFEVLLIASYGLMLHGQGAARLKAGVQYVVVNLVGSTLFLVAVGLLYGATGTLNMADMAVRVAAAPAGDQALIKAGGLLLIVVFGLKAALVPLHFWLPRTYASTSGAMAALFGIMTKVGAYAIIRMTTVVFGASAQAAAWAPGPWLLAAALATMLLGFLGVLGARRLRETSAFAVVGSMGVLLSAVAVFQSEAMAAALYYLVHSTLAGAALFLVADLIAARRGEYGDALVAGPRFADAEALSLLFFIAAIAIVGLPPLSGFVGKLLILDGVREAVGSAWIWAAILGTSLLALLGFARAGSLLFWKSTAVEGQCHAHVQQGGRMALVPAGWLLTLIIAAVVFAGPLTDYVRACADQLFHPDIYVRAVLGGSP